MNMVVCARGFANYVFPVIGSSTRVANHDNYMEEPCVASTFERVDELTPILNGTNDVKNAFLSTCKFEVEKDNREHIYHMSEDGNWLDVTALFKDGNFYLSDD